MIKLTNYIIILILISTINSYPTTYEVGPDKDYKSLQEVTDILGPADTVLVDGNNTYGGDVVFTEAGTNEQPIVIKGIKIEGKRPVISGGANSVHFSSPWPYTSGADNYIFEGFEITGGTSRGIFHQADNLTIKDVVVHDCPAHGILGADQGAGSCFLENVEVYNCGEGSGRHQIYMATDEVNRSGSVFRMEHCYIHDANGGNNVKSRAERNEIYYNWIESAYYHELELIGPDPGGAADDWTPKLKREDSDIVGNVLWKNGSNKDFSVVRFGGDATGESHGRYRFVNNTIICGTGSVFRCFDSLESIEMYNNVFFPTDNNSINLMRTVEAYWTSGNPVIAGSNNWVYEGAQNIPAQWTSTIEETYPGFEDFENYNIKPLSESSLVNSGRNDIPVITGYEFPAPLFPPAYCPPERVSSELNNTRIADGTIDIGAFEYESDNPIISSKEDSKLVIPEVGNNSISFNIKNSANVSFEIYSLNGKKIIYQAPKQYSSGKHRILFKDLLCAKSFAKGIYLLKFKKNSLITNFKIIKN